MDSSDTINAAGVAEAKYFQDGTAPWIIGATSIFAIGWGVVNALLVSISLSIN